MTKDIDARGPERIWATGDGVNGSWTSREIPKSWGAAAQEYIRADLAPDPLADPRVVAMVEALRQIADMKPHHAGQTPNEYHMQKDARAALAALSPTGGNAA